MPRPDKPALAGIYRSPDNRFEWNPAINPSPMRAHTPSLQRQTEGLPVLCAWCGTPFWPPMHILQGCCSDACTAQEQTYLRDRKERDRLLDELRTQEADINRLRALAGKETMT